MMHACRKDPVQIKDRHILTRLMSFLTEPPQNNVGAAILSQKSSSHSLTMPYIQPKVTQNSSTLLVSVSKSIDLDEKQV